MSKYKVITTNFVDKAALEAALAACGLPFEASTNPLKPALHLYGYHGDERPEVGSYVIRRRAVGPVSNDIGWAYNPVTKQYELILSDYDSGRPESLDIVHRVTREYGRIAATNLARRNGYTVTEEAAEDGTIRLICRRR